jgi:hypothetical protein
MTIYRERRVRLMTSQQQIDHLSRCIKLWILQRRRFEYRRIARGNQQRITLTQGNFQLSGEPKHHFAARQRTPRLQKAQMPRRNLGVTGKVELAQAATFAPVAQ